MPRPKQQRNIPFARHLRSNMSLPEVLLWRELRQQTEAKFRRQHPLGRYVLDFYCTEAKVCVDVDGIAHDMGGRAMIDTERDAWLRSEGIEVIRVAAAEVIKSPADVAEALVRYCQC